MKSNLWDGNFNLNPSEKNQTNKKNKGIEGKSQNWKTEGFKCMRRNACLSPPFKKSDIVPLWCHDRFADDSPVLLPCYWEHFQLGGSLFLALLPGLTPGSHAKSCNKSISLSTKMCEPDSLESWIKKEYEYYEPDNCFHNKQTFSKHCPQEGRFEWACQSKPKLHRPSDWSTLDFFVFWVFESTEK